MDRRGLLPFIVTAFFAVMISLFTFSLIDSKNADPNTHQKSNGRDSNSDITNTVENNIKGDKANVNNSIDNDLNNGDNSQIENNVSNDIEVNVDVNVTNKIKNKADRQDSSSEKNKNGNDSSNKNGNKDSSQGEEDGQTDGNEAAWGVDSASLTTSGLLSCVRDNFGTPEIWGRYLGDKEGISAGITPEEAELLRSNDIKILVIWNRFNIAAGLENGQNEARAAIQLAQELNIPEGVAIFADIEPNYPVDSAFIEGWYQTMEESPYRPGIYGIFEPERALTQAFEQAADGNAALLENTYVWTAAPNVGITTEEQAPDYKPQAPGNALIAGWQYGIDAQACNIDTNLFNDEIMDVLW